MEKAQLTDEVLAVLDEVFETHHGIFLDPDTSMFQTLDGISAAQASIPVGGRCASVAAQVAHVTFYLEVLESYLATRRQNQGADWGEIWRSVDAVTPEAWADLKNGLKTTYGRLMGHLREVEDWDDPNVISAAMAIAVHSAYHLGEIRQAMCTLLD